MNKPLRKISYANAYCYSPYIEIQRLKKGKAGSWTQMRSAIPATSDQLAREVQFGVSVELYLAFSLECHA